MVGLRGSGVLLQEAVDGVLRLVHVGAVVPDLGAVGLGTRGEALVIDDVSLSGT